MVGGAPATILAAALHIVAATPTVEGIGEVATVTTRPTDGHGE